MARPLSQTAMSESWAERPRTNAIVMSRPRPASSLPRVAASALSTRSAMANATGALPSFSTSAARQKGGGGRTSAGERQSSPSRNAGACRDAQPPRRCATARCRGRAQSPLSVSVFGCGGKLMRSHSGSGAPAPPPRGSRCSVSPGRSAAASASVQMSATLPLVSASAPRSRSPSASAAAERSAAQATAPPPPHGTAAMAVRAGASAVAAKLTVKRTTPGTPQVRARETQRSPPRALRARAAPDACAPSTSMAPVVVGGVGVHVTAPAQLRDAAGGAVSQSDASPGGQTRCPPRAKHAARCSASLPDRRRGARARGLGRATQAVRRWVPSAGRSRFELAPRRCASTARVARPGGRQAAMGRGDTRLRCLANTNRTAPASQPASHAAKNVMSPVCVPPDSPTPAAPRNLLTSWPPPGLRARGRA